MITVKQVLYGSSQPFCRPCLSVYLSACLSPPTAFLLCFCSLLALLLIYLYGLVPPPTAFLLSFWFSFILVADLYLSGCLCTVSLNSPYFSFPL